MACLRIITRHSSTIMKGLTRSTLSRDELALAVTTRRNGLITALCNRNNVLVGRPVMYLARPVNGCKVTATA